MIISGFNLQIKLQVFFSFNSNTNIQCIYLGGKMYIVDETNEKARYQEIIREYKLILDSTSNDEDTHPRVINQLVFYFKLIFSPSLTMPFICLKIFLF
jgi:hypothetical protein